MPTTKYQPNENRYRGSSTWFRRCGNSGLHLPAISLGCWHNFGRTGSAANLLSDKKAFHNQCREILFTAFDNGITHFDLANNYGPPPGAAEKRVGKILNSDLRAYRDELIISSKAGYEMWPGPYGEWGSRKYLLASLDQSLKRLGLDYVDIFYSHRPDPDTPLEETLGALDHAVRSGKALYAGISNYRGVQTSEVLRICKRDGLISPIIHQPNYNMLDRWIEKELLPITGGQGMGVIAFCPLAQGTLTSKYLDGVPKDSRVASEAGFLKEGQVEPVLGRVRALNELATARGQTMAQMSLAWTLRDDRVTSALIGASRPGQIEENVASLENPGFSEEELQKIEEILAPG